jgi:hypothetical protein
MADISQIKLPNNNTYDIKDTLARGVKMYYGICTTAAATAAKVVTVGADQDFKLTVGALVMVKFTINNSASSVTLNVNNTGAKSIYYGNGVYTGTSTTICGYANAHHIYMYDGTNWVWVGHGSDSNTTYSAMSVSEGKTATATSARTMRSDYLKQIIQYHAVPSGQGVPSGGTAGQILAKVNGTNYNTHWIDAPSGGIEWETVQYEEEKTIPTESFYWHIPDASSKTPSSTNLELMPFLQTLGSGGLGGDIYFKREYYDNSTSYMDTMVYVSSSYQDIIFHHEKGGKWVNEPVKWANYSLSAEYNSGTGEYNFTLPDTTLTLATNQPRWFKHILVNDLGAPDVYIALTTNTLLASGSVVYTPKAINCKMDLFTTYHVSTTPTDKNMIGTIKPIVTCCNNRAGYYYFVDYLLSIHFDVDKYGGTQMAAWRKTKLEKN